MKRLILFLLVCFSFCSLHAQSAAKLKAEGDKALAAKQYTIAMDKYEKALSVYGKKPADRSMIYSMGKCAYSLNDMSKSLKYFDMSIAAGYKLNMAYQYRGNIMTAHKDSLGYIKTLKEGLVKVSNSKALKALLFKYYDSEGDIHYHKAFDILKNAVVEINAGKYSATDNAFKIENDKARV